MAEFLIDRCERLLEIVGILLAQRVEMEAGQSRQVRALELVRGDAQPRARDTGIVERGVAGGALRIDPQPAVKLTALEAGMCHDSVAEAEPLRQRIEVEVVGELTELADFIFLIAGRVGDHVLAEVIARQQGLPQAGGAAAVKVVAEMRECLPTREAFEREDDLAARGIGGFAEDGGIALQRGEGNDVRGHGQRRRPEERRAKFQFPAGLRMRALGMRRLAVTFFANRTKILR